VRVINKVNNKGGGDNHEVRQHNQFDKAHPGCASLMMAKTSVVLTVMLDVSNRRCRWKKGTLL
jgi:hypothetical protein